MITLTTELTPEGVVCTHHVLGKVATLRRSVTHVVNGASTVEVPMWEVFPYKFPPIERAAEFKSLRAAESYALALAYEMMETK